jgi:surface protein
MSRRLPNYRRGGGGGPLPAPPVNWVPPVLATPNIVGSAITVTPGTWYGTGPITLTYTLVIGGTPVPGYVGVSLATVNGYVLQPADNWMSISVDEIALNPDGTTTEPTNTDFVGDLTDFVMTVNTSLPGTSASDTFQFLALGTYDINWGDGMLAAAVVNTQSHTYSAPGTYEIRVRSWIDTGSGVRINYNNGGDRRKITLINQWGNTPWTSFQNAFFGCSNMQGAWLDTPILTSVTNMSQAFRDCSILNYGMSTWNTSAVTNMAGIFAGAASFNQPIDSWNVGAVTSMDSMFTGATAFNQSLNSWNVSSVTLMPSMFQNATAFNGNITSWAPSSVTNMSQMFRSATSFNQAIGSWNTAAVTNMNAMFFSATAFNQNIGSWNVSSVTNMGDMFQGASTFNQNIGSWNTAAVQTMSGIFRSATAFNQNIGSWNTAAVTNMGQMFQGATAFNQNISGWNTAAVTSFFNMFNAASSINAPIGLWNVANVTSMSGMFNGASSFNTSLGAWILNNSVALVDNMFNNSGFDREFWSKTLIGWANTRSTAGTPATGKLIGANGRIATDRVWGGTPYDNGVAAKNYLISVGWSFFGALADQFQPANTVPAVLAPAVVGNNVAVTAGTWTGTATITYTYTLVINGTPVPGRIGVSLATVNSYTYTAGDLGLPVYVNEIATNAVNTVTVPSNTEIVT